MAEKINPINAEMRLAQILGDDYLAQATGSTAGLSPAANPAGEVSFKGNIFEDVLSSAIESLNGISKTERYANQMIESYLRGEVDIHTVMIAQSKSSIMLQLAVTTVNSAVATFKEITQMQI
jgi:flagellar hook-basal body complex protein FliE